jgi:hypothetical protein
VRIARGWPVGLLDDDDAVGREVGTVTVSMFIMKSLSRLKSIVPRPEAGSHPVVAWNPCSQHIDSAVQRLSPKVISFINLLE